MTDVSLQQQINADLKGALIPRPEDLLSEVTPVACVWYLQEIAAYSLMAWAAEITQASENDIELEGFLAEAVGKLAEITGMITNLCITLGLMTEDDKQ